MIRVKSYKNEELYDADSFTISGKYKEVLTLKKSGKVIVVMRDWTSVEKVAGFTRSKDAHDEYVEALVNAT